MGYEGKKVLVVDDSAVMRQIIKKNLKELGFSDLSEAEDGAAGLKKAGEEPVDLIVSDWNMPNMTGLEFLKAVRADDKLKGINFIMVTSEADKEKIMEAVQAGVNQYIVKPFNAMQLEEKIKAIKM
ncbi:MAG: response regulator [Nitrospina sp.]|jgi:two-component system chemotaxis response regulator CheY|nr:response regulator [Nitrospina sp.]MBT6718883.1 response regulator [Nitrospina sp.]